MSGRYFWDGTDMADITGVSTGTDYVNASNNVIFKSIPGTKESSLNGYETYTDNETSFPPFFDNNVSIFRNIKVANTTVNSGTGTITKPNWANACKIYVLSKKGLDGSDGDDVEASSGFQPGTDISNVNINRNTNRNNNDIQRRDDRNHWYNLNIRHAHLANYSSQSGGKGGVGGNGVIYSTSQAFEIQSDDTIDYTINNTHNRLTLNQSDSTSRAIIDINHGTNGTNGTNATITEVGELIQVSAFGDGDNQRPWGNNNFDLYDKTYEEIGAIGNNQATIFQGLVQRDWQHTIRNSNAGVDGANGHNGSVSNVVEFNNYTVNQSINTSITTPSIQVYWFKV